MEFQQFWEYWQHYQTFKTDLKKPDLSALTCTRLWSNRARWPVAPNFCSRGNRKSQLFHRNHMLGTLDFTSAEHWAPFNFSYSTALLYLCRLSQSPFPVSAGEVVIWFMSLVSQLTSQRSRSRLVASLVLVLFLAFVNKYFHIMLLLEF